nr:BTB/POZ and MATH domain-containing protein 1-like [Aegilops tauschii subsp. strangulata]
MASSPSLAFPSMKAALSRPFSVGGHRWVIEYYPNGNLFSWSWMDHISLHLVLDDVVAGKVTAQVQFGFKAGEEEEEEHALFLELKPGEVEAARGGVWRCPQFVSKETLEASTHLKDDSFTIRCDISVFNAFSAEEGPPPSPAPRSIPVPPSDLCQQLGDLLAAKKGADVVFEVGGETFSAHRWLLAAWSPVFSAELFGSMRESGPGVVRVADMDAQVFKALLRFVYTDSWPPETAEGEEFAMAQHLLVAADKYSLKRLKLIYEDKLCKNIAAGTAASILTLAELSEEPDGSHGRRRLRESALKLPFSCQGVDCQVLGRRLSSVMVDRSSAH